MVFVWHKDQKAVSVEQTLRVCSHIDHLYRALQRPRHSIRFVLRPLLAERPERISLFHTISHTHAQEREREIHYVHWASKAYEDESVFMSEADLGWQ